MQELKVCFPEVVHGWVDTTIEYGDFQFRESFSHVPSDSLLELLTLILYLTYVNTGSLGTLIVSMKWNLEPDEYETRFHRTKPGPLARPSFRFELVDVGDPDRCPKEEVVLDVSGSYEEVIQPFLKALRDLRNRYSAEDFRRRWGEAFPTDTIQGLLVRCAP